MEGPQNKKARKEEHFPCSILWREDQVENGWRAGMITYPSMEEGIMVRRHLIASSAGGHHLKNHTKVAPREQL
jgi:hypothetical protein